MPGTRLDRDRGQRRLPERLLHGFRTVGKPDFPSPRGREVEGDTVGSLGEGLQLRRGGVGVSRCGVGGRESRFHARKKNLP